MSERFWIVTCEHGGNRVPSIYIPLFVDHSNALDSHRGWDPGALEVARQLAGYLQAMFLFTTVSRLLIDCNRSIGHRGLFSEISRTLSKEERKKIIDSYYLPHRQKVVEAIAQVCENGCRAIHLAVHSFTPVLAGIERKADIGLLYDSRREAERQFCWSWQQEITRLRPDLKIRRNYPYLGKSDGLATWLRRHYPPSVYIGIEVEINQLLAVDTAKHSFLARLLADTVALF